MTALRPEAFDAFAAGYDQEFTDTTLGRMLRERVWHTLQDCFTPGSHVLELACGTGVDAVWLADRGVRVQATDGSPAMVDVARRRVAGAGLEALVTVRCQTLQELSSKGWPTPPPFDGAYSNFGGLNTIGDWSSLARSLAAAVRPGGRLVLVPMGPYCPWEFSWHLLHGDRETALRRLHQPAVARIGQTTISIWYPHPHRLRQALAPWFSHLKTYSLGLWLPPSYLGHLVERRPALFRRLNRLESLTARLGGGWGDHYVSIFSRTVTPSNKSSMRSPSSVGG